MYALNEGCRWLQIRKDVVEPPCCTHLEAKGLVGQRAAIDDAVQIGFTGLDSGVVVTAPCVVCMWLRTCKLVLCSARNTWELHASRKFPSHHTTSS